MKRAALACLVISAFALAAWARDYHMTNSPSVPAAHGVVSTDHDRNGNTKIHVDVDHLAPPNALTPPASAYVVWVQPSGQPPQNAGELRVNGDLHGSFRSSLPFKNFDIYVTPENDPRATAPTGPMVLKTTVQH